MCAHLKAGEPWICHGCGATVYFLTGSNVTSHSLKEEINDMRRRGWYWASRTMFTGSFEVCSVKCAGEADCRPI